jgi:hypothetical protein
LKKSALKELLSIYIEVSKSPYKKLKYYIKKKAQNSKAFDPMKFQHYCKAYDKDVQI